MIEPNLSLQKPLEDYIEYIEKLSLRSLPLFTECIADSFSLKDPYHDVQGTIDALRVFERRLELYPNSQYKVSNFMWGRGGDVAFFHWRFFFQPSIGLMKKKHQDKIELEGVSQISLLPDGKVFSHAEFWGEHAQFNVKAYQRPLS